MSVRDEILVEASVHWSALAGGSPASAVLRVLSRCSFDVGLYTLMCKGFVLEEWYEEACSVFEDKKVAVVWIVDFVRFVVGLHRTKVWLARASHRVVMEKTGLVCNSNFDIHARNLAARRIGDQRSHRIIASSSRRNPTKKEFWRNLRHHRGWGWPDVLHFRGSVFPNVIPIVFNTALWTVGVCFLYIELGKTAIALPMELVGSVAVVVGLLLAFRTNNAYDRYYEGRKLFSAMCTQVRNSARILWIGVTESSDQDHIEKQRTIKLMLAYVVAVKHHLRLEFGTHWPDLEELLPTGFQLTPFDGNTDQERADLGSGGPEDPTHQSDQEPTVAQSDSHLVSIDPEPIEPRSSIENTIRGITGIGTATYSLLRNSVYSREGTIYYDEEEWGGNVDASMSLPLEIVMHLGLYFDQKYREGKMDPARFGSASAFLNALIENLGNLERIANTPMPYAYNIHLKQAVTLYVWALPLALVAKLFWLTVPCVTVVAFVLFGVEGIGAEIENPFGYDKNDLPLDQYCKDLEAEVKYLQRHIPPRKPTASSNTPVSSTAPR
ncbi:hypothetical protein G9A89_005862 [Geosiphon pyriformis]|nr:hypothetical protein G9A89_005862 [Geosiphon pyriformis]